MSYGRVKFTSWDISFTNNVLQKSIAESRRKSSEAVVPEEKEFYGNVTARLLKLSGKFEDKGTLKKIGFTEEELVNLKGLLLGTERPQLIQRWIEAKGDGNLETASDLSFALENLTRLEQLLEKPFKLDKSQDAQSEDDDLDDPDHLSP